MFDLEHVARIVGGRIYGKKTNCCLAGVSTDSRNIAPDSLFVPLRGENFDGHEYLSQAVKKGAAACISEEMVEGLSVPVVCVEDSLRALGDLAAAFRLHLQGPLVGVTGSAGKTTTKEMLASILEQVSPGLKTAGNFNNLIGLPLTLLRLEQEHRWAVIEMGTSALGEIERLTEIAQPTIGIITNIGAAHLETLHGLDGVSRAKGELFAGLQGGTAVVNIDDERVARLPLANGVKRLTFGLNADAKIRAEDVVVSAEDVCFTLILDQESCRVCLALPGRHNVMNALAAAAAAFELQVPSEKIIEGLETFEPATGRMNLLPLGDGGMLIDDSYNSNPVSAVAGLKALSALSGQGRKIAVLGDMLELGEHSSLYHRELGAKAVGIADLLIAVGGFAKDMCDGAKESGFDPEKLVMLENVDATIAMYSQEQRSGDQILVKGSRGVQLDRFVAAVTMAENMRKGV